jgi:heterodisulfide reductase subunit B
VCRQLDIQLAEVKDWFCCGSTPAHSVSNLLATALPMGNLGLVQKMGLSEVVVPCPSCFSRFKAALHKVENEPDLKQKMETVAGNSTGSGIKVYHPLEIMSSESQLNRIINLRKRDMANLKVVCYYGCLLTRPPKVAQFDICENPQTMDRILQAAGINTLDWSYKTDCCGASFALTRTDIVLKLSKEILEAAKAAGADAIAVACPLCHFNLDGRQREVEVTYGVEYNLPILYFTQLLGLSFGLPPSKLLLKKHFVDATKKLEGVGIHAR